MIERQKTILNLIIQEYINTAEPVSSKYLAGKGKLKYSSATLRNEMAELERSGYIFQPHTSAGRVPTEKGFSFYIDNFVKDKDLSIKGQQIIENAIAVAKKGQFSVIKALAKSLAELSGVAVIVGFDTNDFYYTGLSNLFSQPEFRDYDLVCNMSAVIDKLDEAIEDIFESVNDLKILLGKENPFAPDCGSVLAKYSIGKEEVMLSILGPMRMDYQNNYSLIKYSRELINKV